MQTRVMDRLTHRGMHRENASIYHLAWKMGGAEFRDFWQSVWLNIWSSKGQKAWLGWSPEGIVLLVEKRQANNPWT